MKRAIAGLIPILFLVICLEGCYSGHYQQVLLLKRFAKNQQRISGYLDDQEKLFNKLKADVSYDRLTQGVTKEKIVAIYGEPLLCKPGANGAMRGYRCLYRHPTQYFFSDKIYLTFDEEQKLDSWELIEGEQ